VYNSNLLLRLNAFINGWSVQLVNEISVLDCFTICVYSTVSLVNY
jgi:hypothetical protein